MKMSYYNAEQSVTTNGVFVGYINGYATFHLDNDDVIDFEQIDKKVLEKYNLKDGSFKDQKFEITYSEIIDDLDDEDFVVFKLNNLNLL